jgi:curved DNA-binding protein CbpA
MIDYFALLDQPRCPWLDLDQLKNTYYQKTLQAHPDTQKSGAGVEEAASEDFARLNEGYQVLRDPKRRIHHLLSLEGVTPSPNDIIPEQLHELFPVVSDLTHGARLLLDKLDATSNRLSLSLFKAEVLELQQETQRAQKKIREVFDASLADLREINKDWKTNRPEQLKALSTLYVTFAYVTRWLAQLDEMLFQLSVR